MLTEVCVLLLQGVKAGLASAGWKPEIRDLASFQDDYGLKTTDDDAADVDDDDDDDDDQSDDDDAEDSSEDFELVDKDPGTLEKP
jgi:hypothetical protein